MTNVLKDFFGYLKLGEEEEAEDNILLEDEREEDEEPRKPRKRASASERESGAEKQVRPKRTDRYMDEDDSMDELRERRATRTTRSSGKVVPIRTTIKGLEVAIEKPVSFNDSQDICDMLLEGKVVVVNMEGIDPVEAQRIMDFISGCVYAINGKLGEVSRYIFIYSPENVELSGADLSLLAKDTFEVPNLNKEF